VNRAVGIVVGINLTSITCFAMAYTAQIIKTDIFGIV
jgi:hypothetical protein